jgi:hypothetical protein
MELKPKRRRRIWRVLFGVFLSLVGVVILAA